MSLPAILEAILPEFIVDWIDGHTTSLIDVPITDQDLAEWAELDALGKESGVTHANPAYNAHVDKYGREIPPHKHK